MDRTKYIGGSDIASVLGLSRWKTPLRLWAEKTGEIEPDDLSEVEHVQLGVELEDFVANKFERESGLKVRRDSRMFNHKEHAFLVAHIDRRITGTDELLECKTCSAWKEKEWEGEEIPIEYIYQVQWYLGILGMSKGYIAVLIGGQKFVYKTIEADESLFAEMVDQAVSFWFEFVQKKVPPIAMPGDKDTLFELYPGGETEPVLQLSEADREIVNLFLLDREALKVKEKKIKEDIENAENRVKQIMQDNETLVTDEYKVTWKPQERKTPDVKKMKDDDIFEKYSKVSKSRVMRVSGIKKEE